MKKRILAAGLGIGLAVAGAGFLTACGPEATPTPDGISIHTNFDTTYYVGEELDITGGILNYTKDGKTTQVSITDNMITGFSNETAGTRSMVITYQGETLVVSYVVKDIPEIPFSFEKVYKANESNFGKDSDGNDNIVYTFMKFEKKYDEINFKIAGFEPDRLHLYDTSYNSEIWKEGYESLATGEGVNFEAKLGSYNFNTKTEKWEFEKIITRDSGTIAYTFTNVTASQFNLKIQVSEFNDAVVDDSLDFIEFTMTLQSK